MNQDSKSESPLKERQQQATRRAILAAAEAQIAERGVAGARMEDVAARAGVSVGTIYNHVGGRDALLEELLTTRRQELVGQIDAELERIHGLDFEEQLGAFVRSLFAYFDSHLPLFRVLMQEEVRAHRDPKRSLLPALVERVAALIERGVSEGALPAGQAELYPVLLVGMMRGFFVYALHADVDLGAAADRVVTFFLAGARGS